MSLVVNLIGQRSRDGNIPDYDRASRSSTMLAVRILDFLNVGYFF